MASQTKPMITQVFDVVMSWNGNIFPVTGPLCGEFMSLVNSPHKGQWCRAFMLSLIYTWINGWVNNCEAGNLRCQHAHYDFTVMETDHDKLMLFSMLIIWKYHMYSCLTIPIINMTKEIKTSTQWNDIILRNLSVSNQIHFVWETL